MGGWLPLGMFQGGTEDGPEFLAEASGRFFVGADLHSCLAAAPTSREERIFSLEFGSSFFSDGNSMRSEYHPTDVGKACLFWRDSH